MTTVEAVLRSRPREAVQEYLRSTSGIGSTTIVNRETVMLSRFKIRISFEQSGRTEMPFKGMFSELRLELGQFHLPWASGPTL